jgi:phospholipid/cholesterol/gamma-HCH transport system permease protein
MTFAESTLRGVGRTTLGAFGAARGLSQVFGRTLAGIVRGNYRGRDIVRQMYYVGNRSLLFAVVTLGFIGMVLVFQTALQVNRITGDLSQIGADWVRILVHEFGPTLTGMMLATRVGAGIAAEVGSMVVTEQVDALRMNDVDPIDYLIVPRFLACIYMGIVITVFAAVVALALGALTAEIRFGVNPRTFLDASSVQIGDVVVGFMKCVAYGAATPIVAGYCGLTARGGSEGVGAATTRAVIGASFAVVLLDFAISGFGYFFLQHDAGM